MEPSNEEDKDIQIKLDLLQKEIIDKNLDKENFVNYCLRKKDNGDDLNSWTVDELKELIKEFTNLKNVKTVEPEKDQENEEIKKENVEKMEKINVNKNITNIDRSD